MSPRRPNTYITAVRGPLLAFDRMRQCADDDQNDINRLIIKFNWADEVFNRSQAEDKVNTAPETYRPLIHLDGRALFIGAIVPAKDWYEWTGEKGASNRGTFTGPMAPDIPGCACWTW